MDKKQILSELNEIANQLEQSGHYKQAQIVNEVFAKTAGGLFDGIRNKLMQGVGPQGAAQATQMAQNAPQLPAAFQKFFGPIAKGMTSTPQLTQAPAQPAAAPAAPQAPQAAPQTSTKPSINQLASDIADGKMKFSQLPGGLSFDDKTRIMVMVNKLKQARGIK
jgi:hypothetical protein